MKDELPLEALQRRMEKLFAFIDCRINTESFVGKNISSVLSEVGVTRVES